MVSTKNDNLISIKWSNSTQSMRELVINNYGCIEFTARTEGNKEIAISYWPSLEHIKAWHQNPEHKIAQNLGKSKWYESYEVQVSEVFR